MLPNMERDKLAFIIMFVTDIVLVSIMFLGLIRVRGRGGGMLGLGSLLWKQVRLWWPWCSQSSDEFSARKGVIWLWFATGAGLITVASIPSFPVYFRSQTIYIVGVRLFGPEPYLICSILS